MFVAWLVAGCGEPTCEFVDVIDQQLGPELDDCRTLPVPRGFEEWAQLEPHWLAARACVEDHVVRHRPFIVRFSRPLIDSGTSDVAYVGRITGEVWETIRVALTSTPRFEQFVTVERCQDLVATDCSAGSFEVFDSLCMVCTSPQQTLQCEATR